MSPLGWPGWCNVCDEPMPADDFATICDVCREHSELIDGVPYRWCGPCSDHNAGAMHPEGYECTKVYESADKRQLSLLSDADYEGPDEGLPEAALHKDNAHYYANEMPYE